MTFYDAEYTIAAGNNYMQTGMIAGLFIEGKEDVRAFHLMDWLSFKKRWVSHFFYGAEILACYEYDDRGYYLKE